MTGNDSGEMALADAPGEHLARLVRTWRERLNPDSIAGLGASGRRKRTVSQEDMARLIDSSSHWYARLERGDRDANFSEDFLDRTSTALRLSVEEQPYPAYISDEAWDVVVFNKHMADWFPWVAIGNETNIMRWV
jgi:hypothetical protein